MPAETSQPADRTRLLARWFRPALGEQAPSGFAGHYAFVHHGPSCLGIAAVDDDHGIWYAPAEPARGALETLLQANGFRQARNNSLAALCYHLFARPAARAQR
jgi:hypothetical protein